MSESRGIEESNAVFERKRRGGFSVAEFVGLHVTFFAYIHVPSIIHPSSEKKGLGDDPSGDGTL